MYVFLKNRMGISMKKYTKADFCADQIDVIMNFAVITSVVIKRVHCTQQSKTLLQDVRITFSLFFLKFLQRTKTSVTSCLHTSRYNQTHLILKESKTLLLCEERSLWEPSNSFFFLLMEQIILFKS